MAWISDMPDTTGSESDAEHLRRLYESMVEPSTGEVDNILKIHTLHPRGLEAHFDLYRAVMTGTKTLRKVDREMIALTVSQLNACHY